MGIQTTFFRYLALCSFFLFIPGSSFAEHFEQDSFVDSRDACVEKTVCSRLSRYSVSILSSLLVGILGGYVCGQFDKRMGCPLSIVCTWPLFASLRNFTLAHAEREIYSAGDAKETRVSHLEWMVTIARLAEWGAWLAVFGEV